MSTNRRGPEKPQKAPLSRRPNDTMHAVDDAVSAAAAEVERRLEAEGVPKACVTPRDVLRSRYPRDSFDDEAITEEISDAELFAPRPSPPGERHPPSGTSSLSPFAVAPRATRAAAPVGPRPDSHARHAARSGSEGRGRTGTFSASARSASRLLALFVLGGATAFIAVIAARSPRPFDHAAAPRHRAVAAGGDAALAAAGPATALTDAGPATVLADAAAPSTSASASLPASNPLPR